MPPTNALALLEGFEGSVDVCTNIGECAPENADKKKCGTNTDCEDTTPGHFCKCSNGFAGVPTDKETGCQNIDECGAKGDNNCHAWATCTDLVPLYSCKCNEPGYYGNGVECFDVDECDAAFGGNDCSNGQNSECNNVDGGYYCTCTDGYYSTNDDNSVCADECAEGTHNCNVDATCTNTDGGFECACKVGFAGEGCDVGSGMGCADVN